MNFILKPTSPYDFQLSMSIFSKYKDEPVDIYFDDVYRRLIKIDEKIAFITVKSIGTVNNPKLEISVYPKNKKIDIIKLEQKVKDILNTKMNLHDFYAVIEKERLISEIAKKLYGLRPPRTETFYEALVIAIIEQQISLSLAIRIRGGLVKAYGDQKIFQRRKYYTFPSPISLAKAEIRDLRKLKLSQRKAEYIVDLSNKIIRGEIDLDKISMLSNEKIIDELTKVRGIGRWSAEYAIIRGLGRLDIFPANDVGLKRIISKLYQDRKKVTEVDVRKKMNRWGKYMGLVAFYYLNIEK